MKTSRITLFENPLGKTTMLVFAVLLLLLLLPLPAFASNPAGGGLAAITMAAPAGKVRARIIWPRNGALLSGEQAVYGTAFSRDFSHYTLAYAPFDDPENYTMIGEYHQRVPIGLLGRWDTSTVEDGNYRLKLTVYTGDGRTAEDSKDVGVDNNPPVVSISSPTDGGVATSPFEVTGTATDPFLRKWRLVRESNPPMLLAHLDGTTVNERNGEEGKITGEPNYPEAKFAEGLNIGQGQGLTYPSRKNIGGDAGTVEMWVAPDWEPDDAETHVLLHTETPDPLAPTDCLKIAAEGGNLTFTVYDNAGNPLALSVPLARAGVFAGTPFHLGATWSPGAIFLAVNGFSAGDPQGTGTGVLSTLGRKMHLGFHPGADTYAEATIDELSIYNHPRPLTSIRIDRLAGEPSNMGSGQEQVAQGNDPVVESLLGTIEVPDLPGESLTLTLTARDRTRRRSETSATVFMDNLSPYALITSPSEGAELEGQVEVTGYAFDMDLSSRTLSCREGTDPQAPGEWTQVHTAGDPAWGSTLGTWDTTTVANGDYLLRLVVTDTGGKVTEAFQPVLVSNAPSLSRIEVTPSFAVVDKGGTVQFTAKGYDSEGVEIPLEGTQWAVTDSNTGQIDGNGLFTAIDTGSTKVTASVGEITGEATVEVVQELASIEVTPSFTVLDHGGSAQFTATGYDDQGVEVPITPTWSCNPLSGEIDEDGLFTASGCGTTDITASAVGVEGTATAQVRTYIGGTLTEDTTLIARCNPYVLLETLTVPDGVTLTIEPGVVVKVQGRSTMILVHGILDISGQEDSNVYITSLADDDVWGDTNNDGLETEAGTSDWSGMELHNPDPDESSTISHLDISCAGYFYSDWGIIAVHEGTHQIENSTIHQGISSGIEIKGGSPTVRNCNVNLVGGVYGSGVLIHGDSSATVTGCTIEDVSRQGVAVKSGAPSVTSNTVERCRVGIEVTGCSPEAAIASNTINDCVDAAIDLANSPPDNVKHNHGTRNGTNGITVSGTYTDNATWNSTNYGLDDEGEPDKWLPYVLTSTITVPDGVTLTIEPGVVVKVQGRSTMILVHGILDISGQEDSNVYITSLADNDLWGDTNNDGLETEAGTSDWSGMELHNSDPEESSTISHLDISCAGYFYSDWGIIAVHEGTHQIENSTIHQGISSGIEIKGGSPTVRNCNVNLVGGVYGSGVLIHGDSSATVTGCTIEDVSRQGVAVKSGAPSVTSNTVERCRVGIVASGDASLTVSGCTILDMSEDGIGADTTGTVDISSNTIESCDDCGIRIDNCASPSTIASNTVNNCAGFLGMVGSEPALLNADIHDNEGAGSCYNGFELGGVGTLGQDKYLKKNDIPYTLITGDLTISSGATLTTQPGSVFKCKHHGITVSSGSALVCDESIFTSVFDDSVGGKTINDTDIEKNPDENDWVGITAQAGSSISLNGATLAYGQTLLNLEDGVSLNEVSGLHVINGEYDKVQGVHTRPGGVGIRFNGESDTTIRNSTLEWCEKAVVINLKPSYEGEIYPTISDNNRIWSCTYGIWVEGAISEQHEAILAVGNDWCDDSKFSYNNGPFPIGDGSGIYAGGLHLSLILDVIDIRPWLNQQKDADDGGLPEIGIYQLSSDDGFDRIRMLAMANEFREEYGIPTSEVPGETDSLIRHFELPETASERMLRPESSVINGVYGQYSDMLGNVDLAWINSHALIGPEEYIEGQWTNGEIYGYVCFDGPDLYYPPPGFTPEQRGKPDLRSDNIVWGASEDDDLEWVVIDGCRFFARDSQADARFGGGDTGIKGIEGMFSTEDRAEMYASLAHLDRRYRARTIDNGLHLLLGHATVSNTGDTHCVPFVEQAFSCDDTGERITIVDAYFTVNGEHQPRDRRASNEIEIWYPAEGNPGDVGAVQWGALSIAYGARDSLDDCLWDGNESEDPDSESDTDMLLRSADENQSVPGPSVEVAPELQVTPLDSSGNVTYILEPGSACVCHVAVPYNWPDFVPDKLDDRQDGINLGITAELMRVDEQGMPLDNHPQQVGCMKIGPDHIVIATPDTPGQHYKLRVYNNRTWYWGSPNHILTIEEEQAQP